VPHETNSRASACHVSAPRVVVACLSLWTVTRFARIDLPLAASRGFTCGGLTRMRRASRDGRTSSRVNGLCPAYQGVKACCRPATQTPGGCAIGGSTPSDAGQSAGFPRQDSKSLVMLLRALKVENHPFPSAQQRRALRMLADAPHGCSVAIMLAHGFTNATLDKLVRDGLATIQPGTMRAGTRRITVVRVSITDAGRQVLTGT
jgi:hypothetical protein